MVPEMGCRKFNGRDGRTTAKNEIPSLSRDARASLIHGGVSRWRCDGRRGHLKRARLSAHLSPFRDSTFPPLSIYFLSFLRSTDR